MKRIIAISSLVLLLAACEDWNNKDNDNNNQAADTSWTRFQKECAERKGTATRVDDDNFVCKLADGTEVKIDID